MPKNDLYWAFNAIIRVREGNTVAGMASSEPRLDARVALSSVCLILMFLGAWTCDGAILSLSAMPHGYLAVRCLSLVAYGIAFVGFAVAARGARRFAGERRALRRGLAYGAGALLVGACALAVIPSPAGAAAMGIAFLIKSVGPPLSIAALFLFARLDAARASKAAAVAMGIAFLGECGLRALFDLAPFAGVLALTFGAVCELAGCLLAAALLGKDSRDAFDAAHSEVAVGVPTGTSAREVASVSSTGRTAKVLLCLAATALMLGYLRSGASPGNAVGAVASAAVLVALGLTAWCLPRLDDRALFAVALVCVAAAFLLDPLISLVAPTVTLTLADIGTILFEIIIWIVPFSLVRTGGSALLRAASARLAAVCGHAAGTLVAVGAGALAQASPELAQAAPLVILFIYIVMLVAFTRQVPIAGGGALTGGSDDALSASASVGVPSEGSLLAGQEYWAAPCRLLAEEHGLTPRETEVLEQLAQGRDLAFMEEKFVLSRNTVKMHVRNVYAKLGVHSKQEVIGLVDATRSALVGR